MKQPKRLTRSQKEKLSAMGLDPKRYMICEDNPDFSFFRVVNKVSGRILKVDRYTTSNRGICV